jgi:hypothetical protein
MSRFAVLCWGRNFQPTANTTVWTEGFGKFCHGNCTMFIDFLNVERGKVCRGLMTANSQKFQTFSIVLTPLSKYLKG